jgi:hypothetical protein
MFLLYTKFEINCMSLCIHFDSFKKINFKHLITLIYETQNDIYIICKLFLLIQKDIILLSIGIQESIMIIIM